MPASWTASSYQRGSPRRTASSSTASRPTWRMTTCGGNLAAAEAGHAHLPADRRRRGLHLALERRRSRPPPPRARASRRALWSWSSRRWPWALKKVAWRGGRLSPRSSRTRPAWVVTGPLGHVWSAVADLRWLADLLGRAGASAHARRRRQAPERAAIAVHRRARDVPMRLGAQPRDALAVERAGEVLVVPDHVACRDAVAALEHSRQPQRRGELARRCPSPGRRCGRRARCRSRV